MDRQLRARVLEAEAKTLGISLEDLIAAAKGARAGAEPRVPKVGAYLEVIRPKFTAGTLGTYNTYWRLTDELYGDRPLDTITVDDAVAETFLGHAPAKVTNIDTRATLEEVAAAVSYLTGEPHPLADPSWRPRRAA